VTEPRADPSGSDQSSDAAPYVDTWVVLPTYNEAENIERIGRAVIDRLPGATLLVVDDGSPDGTGRIAEAMAADGSGGRIRVLHRARKAGLGPAYLAGFTVALEAGAGRIVQMDADWSHDPRYLPALVGGLDTADLVIGSRYVRGGGITDWGRLRRIISRGGSIFARVVLGLGPHDLTGGFKAWRGATLAALPREGIHAGGYVFQIEMTFLADRLGARIIEIPIVFTDRVIGQSKMSRRIVVEALVVVLQLRLDELRGRGLVGRRRQGRRPAGGQGRIP
jgi:dolichol-phosphate mannosyltransferase